MQLLVQNGVSVNVSDNCNATPLLLALDHKFPDVAKFLIENGANVQVKCVNGKTPLLLAVKEQYVDIAKICVQKGADVDAVWKRRGCVLDFAVSHNFSELTRLLIDNGVNVNPANTKLSPLNVAARNKNFVNCLLLLCAGTVVSGNTIFKDRSGILRMFMNDLRHQRDGEVVRDLLSREEKWFMYQLASTFALRVRGGSLSYNTFRRVCSFITYHGLFMAPGFERGAQSIWNTIESEKLRVGLLMKRKLERRQSR